MQTDIIKNADIMEIRKGDNYDCNLIKSFYKFTFTPT